MAQYPNELLTLISHLKKFPGVGAKTAERFAFHLLGWEKKDLTALAEKIGTLKEKVVACDECGCLKGETGCSFCQKTGRDSSLFCLISSPKDAFALEETRAFKGLYHVIGTLLSPLEGKHHDQIELEKLKKRLDALQPKEIIIALDSTLEGDATALYLKKELDGWGFSSTRLAFGLPLGSSLDYVDFGTLEKALVGRQRF